MTPSMLRSRNHQRRVLKALATAIHSQGETTLTAIAKRSGLTAHDAHKALGHVSGKGLAEHVLKSSDQSGVWGLTPQGWQEAGVKAPFWLEVMK